MKQFIFKSTALTITIFILGAILYWTILNQFYLTILPITVVFFYVVTNLVHAYLLKMSGKSGSRFTSQYMAISFMKMFFFLAVAIIYVVLHRENAKIFIANFLLLYVLYSGFEVYELTKFMKEKSK